MSKKKEKSWAKSSYDGGTKIRSLEAAEASLKEINGKMLVGLSPVQKVCMQVADREKLAETTIEKCRKKLSKNKYVSLLHKLKEMDQKFKETTRNLSLLIGELELTIVNDERKKAGRRT